MVDHKAPSYVAVGVYYLLQREQCWKIPGDWLVKTIITIVRDLISAGYLRTRKPLKLLWRNGNRVQHGINALMLCLILLLNFRRAVKSHVQTTTPKSNRLERLFLLLACLCIFQYISRSFQLLPLRRHN